jgi:hypothetical protein
MRTPTFTSCTTTVTGSTSWNISGNPPVGTAYYFLNHPVLPCKGSWGQKSNGQERAVICGHESNCTNGLDDDSDGGADCADSDCSGTATCRVQTFAFTDTTGNDIADNALFQFFQTATASATDYIYFDIVETPMRRVSWCSVNAAFYRTNYLSKAPTFGTATSGSWNKWRKAPITGNAWQGPDTAGHLNTFGNDCFGDYSWCSEQFPTEPQNSIFPDRTNDCEIYDLATGFCSLSTGTSWQLTIRIASTRLLACGF